MTTAYILIAAILILGGTIATVGDRIGTRVGKARLSLFNLRPRKTAVLVTILTGSVISASTLAILFAADEQLRTGVFKLEEIQHELRTKRRQLEATNEQKNQVEQELTQAKAALKVQQQEAEERQAKAEKRLERINQSLQAAIAKQDQTEAQLKRTQGQLDSTQDQLSQVKSQFQQAQTRLKTVSQQVNKLRSEIQQRQAELQQLITQRNQLKAQITKRDKEIAKLDQVIGQRDQDIAERNQVIAQREALLKELEIQQDNLERDLQGLRRGNVALVRGQILASRVVRVVNPSGARQAVDQILREANQAAIELTQPGIEQVSERVVRISETQVNRIIEQIDNGQDYVVRIISAGNYVLGEKPVQVFADVARNQMVFTRGEVLASISANPATMSPEEVRQRVELLLGASKFRANSAGILGDVQVSDNRIPTLYDFFEKLKQYNQAVELKAVAAEDIYTVGPLRVELLAMQNGQVVFGTKSFESNPRSNPQPKPTSPPPAHSNPQ